MDSLIEVLRSINEERERVEDAIVQELVCRKHSKKHEINSGHMVRELMERHKTLSLKILDMYQDKNNVMRAEVDSLCGSNEFAEFYGKLRLIKEHHRRFMTDNSTKDAMTVEFNKLADNRAKDVDDENIRVNFTDEEGFGRYLDLHQQYSKFLNLSEEHHKESNSITYLKYIENYDKLYKIDAKVRESKNYLENYLNSLYEYLFDYVKRSLPLLNLDMELAKADHIFEVNFENNSIVGWDLTCYESAEKAASTDLNGIKHQINLLRHQNAEELMPYGMESLKQALQSLGLKCGGTLNERAARLFSIKGKSINDIPSQLKQNLSAKKERTRLMLHGKPTREFVLEVGRKEARIYHLAYIVHHARLETIENVERKQSRTVDELMNEEEAEVADVEMDIHGANDEAEDSDGGDQVIYNPKNLPLDIDGKPIPYWLYKLHGLNLYYDCEICGNTKYRGPKAFQRHFSEWRHAHGLRCLGIPNSPHFHNVLKMDDAVALWHKIKSDRETEKWNAEHEEEFEDSVGNVVNKRVYEDLRKQGLL